MNWIYEQLLEALNAGSACVMVTVVDSKGSAPRKCGAKMLVYADGSIRGTIGGGKFESLVIDQAQLALVSGEPILKFFPLHECDDESFGAICGGEVTVLLEPHKVKQRLIISGAGHCGQALASLAQTCGWTVLVVDDRAELFESNFYRNEKQAMDYMTDSSAFTTLEFRDTDALVLVSRGHPEDRAALEAVLSRDPIPKLAYFGMIGSRRKVGMVMKDMAELGLPNALLDSVYAPLGLDIGSESPEEIAVSVMAEIMQVTRGAPGGHMRLR
ncbi:MAG: XdhC family protein [Pontiella sp.]